MIENNVYSVYENEPKQVIEKVAKLDKNVKDLSKKIDETVLRYNSFVSKENFVNEKTHYYNVSELFSNESATPKIGNQIYFIQSQVDAIINFIDEINGKFGIDWYSIRKGEKGENGEQGAQGTQGDTGEKGIGYFYFSQDTNGLSTGTTTTVYMFPSGIKINDFFMSKNGDFYKVRSINNEIIYCDYLTNLKGIQGEKGVQGDKGDTGEKGENGLGITKNNYHLGAQNIYYDENISGFCFEENEWVDFPKLNIEDIVLGKDGFYRVYDKTNDGIYLLDKLETLKSGPMQGQLTTSRGEIGGGTITFTNMFKYGFPNINYFYGTMELYSNNNEPNFTLKKSDGTILIENASYLKIVVTPNFTNNIVFQLYAIDSSKKLIDFSDVALTLKMSLAAYRLSLTTVSTVWYNLSY